MYHDDLLSGAAYLVDRSLAGRPKQADLNRAISSTYYAIFHTLAKTCADTIVGGPGAARSKPAWRQAYRALDHGLARGQCSNSRIMKKFPKEIDNFAGSFVTMQNKRHDADYDPYYQTTKSEVLSDIALAEHDIEAFLSADLKDRRAFSVFVLLRSRN